MSKRLPGPKNKYRPKVRRVLTFTLTETGHRALDWLLRQTELSRADLLEELIRNAANVKTK